MSNVKSRPRGVDVVLRPCGVDARHSTVNVSPVTDAMHTHDPHGVGDFVHDAVIAHANPPIVLCPGELAASRRAGILRQRANRLDHPLMDGGGKPA